MKPLLSIVSIITLVSLNSATAEEWVKPITIEDSSCTDPMIKIQEEFQLDKGGLESVVQNMKRIDLNKDGQVCVDEALKVAPEQINQFSQVDTNLDKCLTAQELKAAIELRVLEAWRIQYAFMDGNKNQFIEIHELENRFRDPSPSALSPSEILGEFDLNFDSKISWDEYQTRSIELTRTINHKKAQI